MGRYASNEGGGSFKQLPPGTYMARCIRLIDLGTQHGDYMGKPTVNNQVMIMFETPEETLDINGKQEPYIISKFINNWLGGKSKLRTLLEAWRGKEFTDEELKRFDLQNVLGAPAMITVISKGDKSKIDAVGKLMKGMTCPPAVNPVTSFWLDEFDQAKFDALPDGIKAMVARSDEYKAIKGEAVAERVRDDVQPGRTEDFDDDIPF